MHLPLPPEWYLDEDVVGLARRLLGKVIHTEIDGLVTSALITETEAYRGPEDRASHAWNNRRTARTEVMFAQGGVAYVYLCYGIHQLFNIVTGAKDLPHAVLLRGVEALEGEETMLRRRGLQRPRKGRLTGPGSAAKALGLHTGHTGSPLHGAEGPISIRDAGITPEEKDIQAAPRVGVDYAGEDALLPWRFIWKRPDR